MKRNVAIILSGGVGRRLGLSTPKQFFKVAGKMVVEHTVETFESNAHIDEIAIVSNPFYISEFENMVIKNGWRKVKKILKGGKERYDSTLSAIAAYSDSDVNLIIHDAVRPLVSQRIINDVIAALETYRAVDVALPSADTIIEVDGDFIRQIPDRSKLRREQTPQAFSIEVIRQAYDIALKDPGFNATDDCGVVRRYLPEIPIYVVAGEECNMKLTYKEDTYLLDKFFQLRQSDLNEEIMNESELSGKTAVIFGGSYGIGAEIVRLLEKHGSKVYSFSRSQNPIDVGNREEVAKALGKVCRKEDTIHYIINTAGVLNKEPLATMDYAAIEAAIRTNYFGTINVAIESLPYLKKSKGKLIFFTSGSYTRGRAFYSIYSSTNAAIVNFAQAVAQEWEDFGICVNCINPERTNTPMRVRNSGIEPEEPRLPAEKVAEVTVKALLADYTGRVINIKHEAL